MNTPIKWLTFNPKMKEWAWFIALWLGGLCTALALAYPIKLVIKSIS
jgi:hypothetical protein